MRHYQAQTTHQGLQDEDSSSKHKHIQRLQWAMLLIISLITVLALALPVLAYYLTGNWIMLAPAASSLPLGYVWTWIAKRVFPLNEQDHQRALEQIKQKKARRE
jgi:hypothetical protein